MFKVMVGLFVLWPVASLLGFPGIATVSFCTGFGLLLLYVAWLVAELTFGGQR